MKRISIDVPFVPELGDLPVRQQREDLATDALNGLWRRRYLIALITLMAALAAGGVLMVLDRSYRSEAVIRLDFSKREGTFGPDQTPSVMLEAAALIQGEARIIRSRGTARRVVETLGLAADPRYGIDAANPLSHLLGPGGPLAIVLGWLGLDNEPPAESRVPASDPAALRTELAIRDVMSRLRVATENRSYLITIGFTAHDPERAAQVANSFAEHYVKWRLQANAEITAAANTWLAGQIGDVQNTLRDAERSIAEFRESHGIVSAASLGGGTARENATQQRLRELVSQSGAAELTRLNEERRLERVQEAVRSGTLPSSADMQSVPVIGSLLEREAAEQRELGTLRVRLGDRHPQYLEAQAGLAETRARLGSELRRALPIVAADLETARRIEHELAAQVQSQKVAVIQGQHNEGILRERETEVQVIRERLNSLMRNNDQLRAVRDLPAVPASLIVPAEPEPRPSEPKPAMILGAGAGGGLLLAILIALSLERRDQGLRTRADITPEMDVRCLAMLPELPKRALVARAADGQARGREVVAFDEAMYLAAIGIGVFNGDPTCRVILIASALPGEGKSTFAAALAQTVADAGRRVLMVNLTPSQASGRDAGGADPGTTPSVVASAAPGVVVRCQVPTRAEMTASPSNGLACLIDDARLRFDMVLLEAPPVMLLADALVLSRHADTVLLLVRWASTKRRVVAEALRRFRDHAVPVSGLVLTRVNLRRHARMKFFDDCAFYSRERRFYEALPGRPAKTSITGPGV